MDRHHFLLEDAFEAGPEHVESDRVVVLQADPVDAREELPRNDLFQAELVLALLHLYHLRRDPQTLLFDRLFPGLVQRQEELQKLNKVFHPVGDRVRPLDQFGSHLWVLEHVVLLDALHCFRGLLLAVEGEDVFEVCLLGVGAGGRLEGGLGEHPLLQVGQPGRSFSPDFLLDLFDLVELGSHRYGQARLLSLLCELTT